MKRKQGLFFVLLSFLACAPLTVPAQTPPGAPGATTPQREIEEAQREFERKAYALLDDVISEAGTVKLPENLAMLQARAANLLWPQNEKRARALFADAVNNLGIAIRNLPKDSNPEARETTYWTYYQLRQQLIMTVARRDAGLALELLRATRQQNLGSGFVREGRDNELGLEQQLAARAAASDPKRALQIASESLARGVSSESVGFLNRLAAKDKEAAAKFFTEIVSRLRSTNLTTNHEAANVAMHLLRIATRPSRAGGAVLRATATSPNVSQFTPDAEAVRDLAGVIATAALAAPPASPLLIMLQPVMPEIEKYVPDRAQLLQRKLAESRRAREGDRFSAVHEYHAAYRSGTPEAMLEAAAKAPPEMRADLYSGAATIALDKGDAERARQIVTDHIKDGAARDGMLAYINRVEAERAASEGKIEEAQRLAALLRSNEERAALYARLATKLAEKGDRKKALQLLEEAMRLVGGRARKPEQVMAQMGIARAYAGLDPARSFEIIESVIDQTNDMIAAASVLNGFMSRGEFFRDGELILRPEFIHYAMYGGENYMRALGKLARADFSRARSAADRFNHVEVRLLARLLLVEGALSNDTQNESDTTMGMLYGDM